MNNKTWHQIEIEDPEFLPGKNLVKLIEQLEECLDIKFVVLHDLMGAMGFFLNTLVIPDFIDIKKFKSFANKATQFDWGYFYLCSTKENAQKICQRLNDEKYDHGNVHIPDTGTTIRAFDDESFIIYTSNPEVVALIKRLYPQADFKEGTLNELEFYF